MYTQCPDCDTAFRVTAEVLKQAAGKVRCGGCGNAFNALEYLSEEKPRKKETSKPDPEPKLPELAPESGEADAPSGDDDAKTMSAAQSAALLKTLDELAGSDIRIEDTGVEWRVFDDDEGGEDEPDPVNDTGSMKWFLEDDFPEGGDVEPGVMADVFEEPGDAVIDEVLEEAPTPVDELLTESPSNVEAGEIFSDEPQPAATQTPIEELRFDDNTPLPDDFDFDDEPASTPPVEEPAHAVHPLDGEAPASEEVHVDLAFGDVDDWEALLDEVEVPQATAAEPEEPPDHPPDIDTQFDIQAEAMGIDLSGIHETAKEPEAEPVAADDAEAAVAEHGEAELAEHGEAELAEHDEAELAEHDEAELAEHEEAEEAPASISAIEALAEDLAEAEAAIERSTSDEYKTLDVEDFEDLEIADDDAVDEPAQKAEEQAEAVDEQPDEAEQIVLEDERVDEPVPDEALDEHYVPPPTEEEQTINMQIDQDLMAMAVEDEDGFASTIVKGSIEEIVEEDRAAGKTGPSVEDFESAAVETIVMEGEYVMSELERERREREAAEAAEAADLVELGIRPDTRESGETKIRGGRRKTDPPSWGSIAAVIVLALILVLQVLHQSRDRLATIPAFNKVVGPLYRLIGQPLQPSWDISGWRFEATRGNADEANETLTIYSRLGNKSGQPLPYPLISVALTDRFEETIGNKVLEPGEYLAGDLDPRQAVAPGNTFNAVIAIKTPSADATGYKLNVCYRIEGGMLRCAIEDFR